VRKLTELTYKALTMSLISDHKYPENLLKITEDEIDFGVSGLIIDTVNANCLKLGANNEVLRG